MTQKVLAVFWECPAPPGLQAQRVANGVGPVEKAELGWRGQVAGVALAAVFSF